MGQGLRPWVRWALIAEFVVAGIAKLAGMPAMVSMFAIVGAGQWFRYAVGAWEIMGAILLSITATQQLGVIALSLLMLGAAAVEIFVLQRIPVSSLGTLIALTALSAMARPRKAPPSDEVAQHVRQNSAMRVVTQLFRRVDS